MRRGLIKEAPMPDDKSKVGEPDRSRVAADYEVSDEAPVGNNTTFTIGNGRTTHGGRRKRYPSAHGSGYAFTPSEKVGALCEQD